MYIADGHWDRGSMDELQIPQSLRVAIQSRVERLPQAAQETLHLAAVLGREFDFQTLVEASALGETMLIDSLETAERAQLVAELSGEWGGTFIFAHALIPTILAESLSGLRRRHMHRQVMTAIERLRPDGLESLAFHALEGGNLQKGLDFSVRAAQKAESLFAFEEALLHYGRAREIAESLDLPEWLQAIYEAIGDAQLFRDVPESAHAFEQPLNLTTDPAKRTGIKSKIGTTYAMVGDQRGREFLEAAINELDPDAQGNELALATAYVGRLYHYHGQHRKALTYLEQARKIDEPLDEPETLCRIYGYLAGAHMYLAEFAISMEWARQAVALGERKKCPRATMVGYEYLAEVLVAMGEWQETLRVAGQERRAAKETGWLYLLAWAEDKFAEACWGLGDLLAAEEAGWESMAIAAAVGDTRLMVMVGARCSTIQTDLGQAEIAEKNARKAVERGTDLNHVQMAPPSLGALAYWHMQHGDWASASKHLGQCARMIAESDTRLALLSVGPWHAEASLGVGQLERAADLVEETLALAREAPSPHIEAVTRRVQAQVLAAQGSWEEAARCFEEAITGLERLGSCLELGRALYHQGQMQAQRGNPHSACASLARALDIFQDCSAKLDAARARTTLNSLETGD